MPDAPESTTTALDELTTVSDASIAELAALPDDQLEIDDLKAFGLYERVMAARGTPVTDAAAAPAASGEPPTAPLAGSPEAGPTRGQPVPSIPKPRFDEVLAQRNAAIEDAAQARKLLADMAASAATLAGHVTAGTKPIAATAEPTPKEQLAALSKQFEDGELTMDEYLDQRDAIRDAGRRTTEPAAADPAGSLALQAATRNIINQNGWVAKLREAQFADITEQAKALYAERGLTRLSGELADLEYRKCFIEAGHELGYARLHGAADQPAPASSGTPGPGLKQGATSQPPDIASGTQNPNGNGIPDEGDIARYERMSSAELMANPKELDRLIRQYLPT